MKNKTALKYLIATAIFISPLSVSISYAQDANDIDIFDRLGIAEETQPDEAELNEPSDATPDAPVSANAFDAYQNAVESDSNDPFLGQADNEIAGEPTPEDLEAEIRDEAFNAAVNGFLPLRPDEIRRFLEIYDEVKQASNTPVYPYPQPESKIQEISFDPADPPQVIKLATGHVTHVAFYDSTGERWPIRDVAWAGDFEFNYPEEGGESLRIIPMSDFSYGNMVVYFSTLDTPAVFTLQAQREIVHVRYDAILPEPGPFARVDMIQRSGPTTTSGSLRTVAVLDGTPPDSANMMRVSGVDSRTKAYQLGGDLYLRTPHTLISPAWKESASSGDGMNVYVINKTPVVLLSDDGDIVRAFIEDKDNL